MLAVLIILMSFSCLWLTNQSPEINKLTVQKAREIDSEATLETQKSNNLLGCHFLLNLAQQGLSESLGLCQGVRGSSKISINRQESSARNWERRNCTVNAPSKLIIWQLISELTLICAWHLLSEPSTWVALISRWPASWKRWLGSRCLPC